MSAVTDQVGMQELGANTGDFDDDDGGGLVRKISLLFMDKNYSLHRDRNKV